MSWSKRLMLTVDISVFDRLINGLIGIVEHLGD